MKLRNKSGMLKHTQKENSHLQGDLSLGRKQKIAVKIVSSLIICVLSIWDRLFKVKHLSKWKETNWWRVGIEAECMEPAWVSPCPLCIHNLLLLAWCLVSLFCLPFRHFSSSWAALSSLHMRAFSLSYPIFFCPICLFCLGGLLFTEEEINVCVGGHTWKRRKVGRSG